MQILLLCEGNAETHDSWSGISKSVLTTLRAAGHEVWTGDVDVYGARRLAAAAATWAPRRQRWSTRFHFGARPFTMRSLNAAKHIAAHAHELDVILQFGATFEPRGRGDIPYVLYCDSNIRLAQRNRKSGFGEAVTLSDAEIEDIDSRESEVYRNASVICTISDYLARSFQDDYGIEKDRLRTINAGPNTDLSRVGRRAGATRTPTILFVGRQFGRKGGDLLLRAFARVRERVPEAQLVLVGPRGLELNEPGVRCTGLLDKDDPADLATLEQLYSEASVFCLPSRFDCFPISFLEAMAYELPCVGTDIAGVPEIVADEETGFIVPVDDAEVLADRLVRVLTDPELAARLGRQGRERLQTRFTWPAVVDRMLEAMRPLETARL